MAIIACPECGKEVSNKARNCPSCGVRITKSKALKVIAILAISIPTVFVLSGLAVGRLSSVSAKRAVLSRIDHASGYTATITSYNDNSLTGEYYVCGLLGKYDPATNNWEGSRLFYVLQKGPFRSTEKAALSGDVNFDAVYTNIACPQR